MRSAVVAGLLLSFVVAAAPRLHGPLSPAGLSLGGPGVARATPGGPPAPASPATLWIGHGTWDGTHTTIARVTVGASSGAALPVAMADVEHVRGSAVRGAVLGAAAFVAVEEPGPKGSTYVAALHRIDGGGAQRLCGGLAKATGPRVVGGRLLVARGVDGAEPVPGPATEALTLRVDTLTIDAIDPSSGAARTLWTGEGYQAFLAGALGDEVIVYHSRPAGAALFALHAGTGAVRPLGDVAPFARDFSVDAVRSALVFANVDAAGRHAVTSLDLRTAARATLFVTQNDHPMPFALPGGDVVVSSDGDHGLLRLVRGPSIRQVLLSPAGDGTDAATHAEGRWLAVRHARGKRLPRLYVVDVDTGQAVPVAVEEGHLVEALGFEAGGAS